MSTPRMVRHDICRHNYAVERGLVVGFCAQPHHCYWPYYPTARFPSPSSHMVSDEPFPDRSRPMSCWLAQTGSHPITCLWLWPATDHEPHCRHVPINTIWRWTESTPWSGWWLSHVAGIYSDCSTREIIINNDVSAFSQKGKKSKTCMPWNHNIDLYFQQWQMIPTKAMQFTCFFSVFTVIWTWLLWNWPRRVTSTEQFVCSTGWLA